MKKITELKIKGNRDKVFHDLNLVMSSVFSALEKSKVSKVKVEVKVWGEEKLKRDTND